MDLLAERKYLGFETFVNPMFGDRRYDSIECLQMREVVEKTRIIKHGRFEELGKTFAKKFAPLNPKDYSDAKATRWLCEVWFERSNSFLGNRTPMKAIQDGDEDLVIHLMVCAVEVGKSYS